MVAAAFEKVFITDVKKSLNEIGDTIYCGCLPSCNNLQYDYKYNSDKFASHYANNASGPR